MTEITSRSNPRVRAAVGLRDRRERVERGLTIVDGAREVGRALASGIELVEAFVSRDRVAHSADAAAVLEAVDAAGIAIVELGAAAFERVAFGDRSDGLVAVVRVPSTSLADLSRTLGPEPLLVVVEGVEKPGNVGAIVRTADAAGASGVVLADPRTDAWNPNAIRASLGTIFAVAIAEATAADAIAWLTGRGVRVVAARVDGERRYDQADLAGSVAIALGSEARGLSEAWRGPDVTAVRLPMLGVADSLNVSATAAVLLYESRRQRDARGGG
jgi:TrmH family RNA methyltransferase